MIVREMEYNTYIEYLFRINVCVLKLIALILRINGN